ncbi:MAG: hypothetical protein M1820_002644 [Bogoriella megaspora]|nr:MAG: hypothetical protein M1820_002644 [Bogoriella megaspora]
MTTRIKWEGPYDRCLLSGICKSYISRIDYQQLSADWRTFFINTLVAVFICDEATNNYPALDPKPTARSIQERVFKLKNESGCTPSRTPKTPRNESFSSAVVGSGRASKKPSSQKRKRSVTSTKLGSASDDGVDGNPEPTTPPSEEDALFPTSSFESVEMSQQLSSPVASSVIRRASTRRHSQDLPMANSGPSTDRPLSRTSSARQFDLASHLLDRKVDDELFEFAASFDTELVDLFDT